MSPTETPKPGRDRPSEPEGEVWRDQRWRGGKARAAALSPERRSEIARKAAASRWCAKEAD